ncbi:MAG: S8 family serine peptidase [Lachnospiraceae bacterium]|nr:S8 family serine peptidase [Lachnospiraceae bacterium]
MKSKQGRKILAVMLAAAMFISQGESVYAANLDLHDESFLSKNGTRSENTETITQENSSLPYGLKGMPQGYTLNEEELQTKNEIRSMGVLEAVEDTKAGTDYVEDEVIFSCDDPEYAKIVAEAYNGTLLFCEYGVAVIKLDKDKITVEQAVSAGADMANALPPVNPNGIIYCEPGVISPDENMQDTEILSGTDSLENSWDSLSWSYWHEKYNDPAMVPGYTYTNADDGKQTNGYEWMLDAVGAYEAWGVSRGEGVTVAVLDTGVDMSHEDLEGQVSEYWNPDPENYKDFTGHGTHVAGIIAAKANNGIGGVGVAPEAKILDVPVFTVKYDSETKEYSSYATDDSMIKAINYVADEKKAQVINMSLGGQTTYNTALADAINNAYDKDVTICAALGNTGTNSKSLPAAYDHVIAVSSVDESLQRSSFSSYGSWADIAAPGSNIFSTWNGADETVPYPADSGKTHDTYCNWNGTSMASPLVAGVCALYISAMGGKATPDQVETALKESAVKISSDRYIGAGMVNVANMMPENNVGPEITAESGLLSELDKDSTLLFSEKDGSIGNALGYVFTVNGKDPSAKDGEVKEGYFIKADLDTGKAELAVQDLIDLGTLPGIPLSLKAIRITGKGSSSDVTTTTIKIQGQGLEIRGVNQLGKGKSATYSAYFKDDTTYTKAKVVWSLENAPEGVKINKNTGKITTKANSYGTFTVVAASQSPLMTGSMEVELITPANKVTLLAKNINEDVNRPEYDKTRNLKSAYLFNADIPVTEGTDTIHENILNLVGKADNGAEVCYLSSNPAVAEVDSETGVVTAKKAGTAKITCKANDGSNKKITVTLKVIVPISKLSLIETSDQSSVAYGKNIKLRAALGSTYGNPSIKKVKWDSKPSKVCGYDGSNTPVDVTETCNNKSYIKINKGSVTVDKRLSELGYNYYTITVRASTLDGTGLVAEKELKSFAPTTTVVCNTELTKGKRTITLNANKTYVTNEICFITDYGYYYATTSLKIPSMEITSSNPNVLSAGFLSAHKLDNNKIGVKLLITTYKPGNSTIKFRVKDGTNKSATINVKVE